MKIVTRYVAEDGKLFDDPLKCQDYEAHQMGVIPGSVAALIQSLKKIPKEKFCTCLFYIRQSSGKTLFFRAAFDLEPHLAPFVNVDDLEEDKRCIIYTIDKLIKDLAQFDKDAPVCGMMVVADDIKFTGDISVMQTTNQDCWDKQSETQ